MSELNENGLTAVCRELTGKYRGTVVANVDPQRRGRLLLVVPDVSKTVTTWARPCLPVGGLQNAVFSIPPVGSKVWVEFEKGDPDYPVWVGTFWGDSVEAPTFVQELATKPGLGGIAIQTPQQNGVLIADGPSLAGPNGGILIKAGLATITINDNGIFIQNGRGASISLLEDVVSINKTALTVKGV